MNKRWTILEDDKALTKQVYQALNIHPLLCKILVQRGIDNYQKAKSFFRPTLDELHDPFLMKGMHHAVTRILSAIEKKEKILIYGDYDVDGTTSVACMYLFIKKIALENDIDFYIPNRYREGYGISRQGVDYAIQEKFSLVIALDCGIKSKELIQYARENKVEFIVCDHHLPDDCLPPAVAILNPKQKDCSYPFKELCGCGVGFKLISALAKTLYIPFDEIMIYLDLVATAIAADIVSITGENRILAWYGLKQVNEAPSIGIKALMQVSNTQGKIKINNLVFMIAPRVNAAGRMDDARKAVQMFISPTIEEATTYAKQLHADNDERKETDTTITEEALQIIANQPDFENKKSIVVFDPNWHKGVVGIVASRLIERHYKPTVVLTKSGEMLSGSARSVAGFDLYEAIHACRMYLTAYGGHFAAAGLSLNPENLLAFKDAFETAVANAITEAQQVPEIVIDAVLPFDAAQLSFLRIIEQMEPFGPDNLRPVFITRNTMDTGNSKIVKEHHLQLFLRDDTTTLKGIYFKGAALLPLVKSGPVDIVYTLDLNDYNGLSSVQLKVIDLKKAAT